MLSEAEILMEPAGPRLDAWVAEHVMGLTILGDAPVWEDHEEPVFMHVLSEKFRRPGQRVRSVYVNECCCAQWSQDTRDYLGGHGPTCLVAVAAYSSDLEAAWEVVEKVAVCSDFSLWREAEIHYANGAFDCAKWGACLANSPEAFATTAPLAISRAALLAVVAYSVTAAPATAPAT